MVYPFPYFLLFFSTLATTINGWISEEPENKEEKFDEEPSSLQGIAKTTSSILNWIVVALIFFLLFFYLLFSFSSSSPSLRCTAGSLTLAFKPRAVRMETRTTLQLRLTLQRSMITARDEGMKPKKRFPGRESVLRKGTRERESALVGRSPMRFFSWRITLSMDLAILQSTPEKMQGSTEVT